MDDATRWDQIHQRTHHEDEPHSKYVEHVESQIPRNSLVLEIGAGTGADAMYLLKHGHSLIALDISEFGLNKLNEKAKKENFTEKLVTRPMDLNLHSIPVKDNSVGIIYSRISINYFGVSHTTRIFRDIYRVLRQGGKAYITMKSPDDPVEMEYLQKAGSVYEQNVFIEGEMLRSRFSIDQLKQMLVRAGIINFSVNPYKEASTKNSEEESEPVLYVNEIVFTKE